MRDAERVEHGGDVVDRVVRPVEVDARADLRRAAAGARHVVARPSRRNAGQSSAPESPVPRSVDEQQVAAGHQRREQLEVVVAAVGGRVARAALDRDHACRATGGRGRAAGSARTRSAPCRGPSPLRSSGTRTRRSGSRPARPRTGGARPPRSRSPARPRGRGTRAPTASRHYHRRASPGRTATRAANRAPLTWPRATWMTSERPARGAEDCAATCTLVATAPCGRRTGTTW